MPEIEKRKVSVSLYLAALLITSLIFAAGIFTGKQLEQDSLNSISSKVDSANLKASSLQLLYLIGDSPDFCPVYVEELQKLDSSTEQVGYSLSFLEENKGITDVELKKKYFILEAEAYLLSQKVKENCGANYSSILYFYSNKACGECARQGLELLGLKKQLGEKIRIYSFDGDLGSEIVNAFKKKHGVTSYPAVSVNGAKATNGFTPKEKIREIING